MVRLPGDGAMTRRRHRFDARPRHPRGTSAHDGPIDEDHVELIGELERLFATSIYPNRGLVAAVLGTGALLLAILAARRRWDLAVRRHPRLAAGIAVPVLALGLPLGWYLGSPLFLSSTANEPPPIVAAVATPSPALGATPGTAPARTPDAATPGTISAPSVAPPALGMLAGELAGADAFHFGRGQALLIEVAPGTWVVRLEGFEVRNGPDLFVYLSPSADGYADGAVEIGRLKADKGNQNYEVPADVAIDGVRSVVIWCREFAVLFATAPLS
jgi:hypothetical protein